MDWRIKIHRKILDWERFTDSNAYHLFSYCLLRANIQDTTRRWINIKAGSFITSLPSIQKDTGLTIQSIRTCLNKLKSTGELTDQSTNKYRIISICRREDYQIKDKKVTGKPTDRLTVEQQATNRQLTADKKEENIKKEKNNNIAFDLFWDLYDKKVWDKIKTQSMRDKLTLEIQEKVMTMLPNWKRQFDGMGSDWTPRKQFQPYPSTFLHGERWNDTYDPSTLGVWEKKIKLL